jgi:hypothetical protein
MSLTCELCTLIKLKVDLFFEFKVCFTLGVKANVQLKSSISIGAKVEISPPRAFH